MDANAKGGPLLYASIWDTGEVYVYTYPKIALVGKLLGVFATPAGMCSDATGDVWITNYHGNSIYEYPHGGTKPILTLRDGIDPNGCSVDPTTGDLAVTGTNESITGPSESGAFAVYRKAEGFRRPHYYSVPYATTTFCSYDDEGNLFVDGQGWRLEPPFALSELRKGATSAATIILNQTLYSPGAVQWYRNNLTVGDTATQTIYRFAIDAGSGTQVGSIHTDFDSGGQPGQFWIYRAKLILPTWFGPEPAIRFYTYPRGSGPVKMITGLKGPYGVTISLPRSIPERRSAVRI